MIRMREGGPAERLLHISGRGRRRGDLPGGQTFPAGKTCQAAETLPMTTLLQPALAPQQGEFGTEATRVSSRDGSADRSFNH